MDSRRELVERANSGRGGRKRCDSFWVGRSRTKKETRRKDGRREREREREKEEPRGRGWIEERISVLWMEFGMRESLVERIAGVTPRGPHEKLWLLPAVNGEGQPTKNNITFYGQPNFVARWWAYARPAVRYRRSLSPALRTPANNIRLARF